MKKIELKYVFLLPIFLTMIVSISHVMSWYSMANTFMWAIFMSISIEIGAMAALVAATKKIKGGVWVVFGLVTFVQMVGNIFYCYKQIDPNGELFKAWMELTSPVWESLGSDITDIVAQKRWLAFLEGGLLPIISLTSLHFFIKYEDREKKEDVVNEIIVEKEVPVEVIKEVIVEKEVPVEVIKEVIVEKEVPVEVIKEVIVEKEVPVKYFVNDDGDIYDEDGHNLDPEKITTSTTTDDEVRRLTYTKPS